MTNDAMRTKRIILSLVISATCLIVVSTPMLFQTLCIWACLNGLFLTKALLSFIMNSIGKPIRAGRKTLVHRNGVGIPRHFFCLNLIGRGESVVADKILSCFIDEAGDFGEYDFHSPYYIVSVVTHDRLRIGAIHR